MSTASLETDSSPSAGWPDSIENDSSSSPAATKASEIAFYCFSFIGLVSGCPRKKRPISAIPLANAGPIPITNSPVDAQPYLVTPPIHPLFKSPVDKIPATFPPHPLSTAAPVLFPVNRSLSPVLEGRDCAGQPVHIPYALLRRKREDEDQIAEIVTSIGKCSAGEISFPKFGWTAFKKFPGYDAQMNSPEQKELHPFKFLAIIFTDPNLRKYMPGIFQDPSSRTQSFLRNRFMEGVNRGMEREAKRGKLTPYLEPFAAEVGVSVDALRPLIRDRSWEQIVRLLIAGGGGPQGQKSRVSQS